MAQRKSLGTDLPKATVDKFNRWVERRQMVKASAAATALELLQRAPSVIRDCAIAGRWDIAQGILELANESFLYGEFTDANDPLVIDRNQKVAQLREALEQMCKDEHPEEPLFQARQAADPAAIDERSAANALQRGKQAKRRNPPGKSGEAA
jgi:hypothetical protein